MSKLLPCPFCGGSARFVDGKDDFEHTMRGVSCSNCPAEITYSPDAYPYDTEDDYTARDEGCVEAWNRRADAAELTRLRSENAELVGARDQLRVAITLVREIIKDGAMTGFNCHDGDWAERLFASQAVTHRAISRVSGGGNG
jgi:Lar family restriction alleviation protein